MRTSLRTRVISSILTYLATYIDVFHLKIERSSRRAESAFVAHRPKRRVLTKDSGLFLRKVLLPLLASRSWSCCPLRERVNE